MNNRQNNSSRAKPSLGTLKRFNSCISPRCSTAGFASTRPTEKTAASPTWFSGFPSRIPKRSASTSSMAKDIPRNSFPGKRSRGLKTKPSSSRPPKPAQPYPPFVDQKGWILLNEHLMGQTILDIDGRRTEVVNDVHLLFSKGRMILVHVDISFNGFLRKWGLERFATACSPRRRSPSSGRDRVDRDRTGQRPGRRCPPRRRRCGLRGCSRGGRRRVALCTSSCARMGEGHAGPGGRPQGGGGVACRRARPGRGRAVASPVITSSGITTASSRTTRRSSASWCTGSDGSDPKVALGHDPTAVFFGQEYFNHRDPPHRRLGLPRRPGAGGGPPALLSRRGAAASGAWCPP